jgi:hypothetical protein
LEFSIVVIPDQHRARITRKALESLEITEDKAVLYGLKITCEGDNCNTFTKNQGDTNEDEIQGETKEPTKDPVKECPDCSSQEQDEVIEEAPFFFRRLGKQLSPRDLQIKKLGKIVWK